MSDATTALAAAQVATAASQTASDAADFAVEKAVEVNADRVAAQAAKTDAQAAAAAAGAQMWVASEAVTTATVRQAPDGSRIRSNAARTTRATFDPTEQGFWTPVLSTAGTLEQVALSTTYVGMHKVILTTDTAAEIQAKADACASFGATLGIPAGTWDTSASTITFQCSVLADPEATFTSDATPAIAIGNGTTLLSRARVTLPKVTRKTKNWGVAPGPGAGVVNTDVGVRIDDTRNCLITIPHVKNFSVGIDVADDAGSLYNTIILGHLENNATNLRAATTGAGGAANECQVIGGRYSHNSGEGTNVAGTRHIALLTGATVGPNNWQFHGGSIEGDTPEYHLECHGSYNQFIGMRWEATTPKALFSSAASTKNVIFGGYNADAVTVTQSSSAIRNILWNPGIRMQGAFGGGANGVFIIQNSSSSDQPILVGLPTTADPYGTPSTSYGFSLTSQFLRGKQTGDANPRVLVDFNSGKIGFGSGTAAISQYIRQETSTLLGFQATGICASTDNTYDIGASGTRRFRDLFLGRNAVIGGELDHDGTRVGFYGTAPALKPTALTAANASAVNSGDATTDTVINNMRTRIGELEAKLQSLGLIT